MGGRARLWLRLNGSGGVQTAVRGLRRNISPSSSQIRSVMVPTHLPPSIHMLVAPSSLPTETRKAAHNQKMEAASRVLFKELLMS